MQTSQSFVLLVVIPRPTRYRSSFTKRGVFRPKIKILQRFKQDHWKKMPATKRVGRDLSHKSNQQPNWPIRKLNYLVTLHTLCHLYGSPIKYKRCFCLFFYMQFSSPRKIINVIFNWWMLKSKILFCERAISPSVIEENKSRNALAELLDAKFGTGLTAIKASNFNTADRHKRSRVLRNLFLNKYKNPKQLHTQTRINFVFFVASR